MTQAQRRAAERDLLFEARAREHLKRTHSPESLEGLDWNRPPTKEQPFTYIFEFHLLPEKRPDRAEAPCPLCSPHSPKYYHGALVWFPLEGVYRCIGRECAAHYIGKAQAQIAERDFRSTQRRNSDFEFLFINLGLVPSMIRHFEALLPAAVYAEKLRHALGTAHVREPLRKTCRNHDGWLAVWDAKEVEKLNPSTGDVQTVKEQIRVRYGRLKGFAAVDNAFDITRKLRIEITALQAFDQGEDEVAQTWVIDHAYDHADNMKAVCQKLRNAKALQLRAVTKIMDVLKFFSEENFRQLAEFGNDPRNTISLCASFRNGEFRIGPTLSECISIRPDFGILKNLPAWPELRLPANDGDAGG